MALHWKRQQTDDTPHKLLPTQTILITQHFWQIHPPRPSPSRIVWSGQQAEYVCFNQSDDISKLNGGFLRIVHNHGSSFSSTENSFNMGLVEAWAAIDRLSIRWKSDLSNKIKRIFFQAVVVSILLRRWLSLVRKSLTAITQGCYELYQTNSGSNIL